MSASTPTDAAFAGADSVETDGNVVAEGNSIDSGSPSAAEASARETTSAGGASVAVVPATPTRAPFTTRTFNPDSSTTPALLSRPDSKAMVVRSLRRQQASPASAPRLRASSTWEDRKSVV